MNAVNNLASPGFNSFEHTFQRRSPLMLEECSACRLCQGAAHQVSPILFVGNPIAPILVIAQNPGEIKPTDEERQWWITEFGDRLQLTSGEVIAWSRRDFMTSTAYFQFARIFGIDWLRTEQFIYTNSVRCRTPKNATPSDEMIENCSNWTAELLPNRKMTVLVGDLARSQVLQDDALKLDWGTFRKHPTVGPVMAIKHYRAWTAADVKLYTDQFAEMKGKFLS